MDVAAEVPCLVWMLGTPGMTTATLEVKYGIDCAISLGKMA